MLRDILSGTASATKQVDWVQAGDRCTIDGRVFGTVLHVTHVSSIPHATVKWDSGSTGRHTITLLKHAKATKLSGMVYPNLQE